ncbi:hypothetical protein M404DRAFT_517074 [Pisolithus tinctorius Marx 270]|uniref:Uncharacterized protein n=1 Tax=Pisolithus tinctorius Marx 270 TaxID=870435 RepID=A0A0C3J873_PISTI|nr:hypothetical protein M404DRAFT_517074 [Pisolithus tinctorius Marx 270]
MYFYLDIFDLSPSPGPLECEDLAIIEHCYAVGKTKWELFASCCVCTIQLMPASPWGTEGRI